MALGKGCKALGAVADLMDDHNALRKQNSMLCAVLEEIATISIDSKYDAISRPDLLKVVLLVREALTSIRSLSVARSE
jgi:hypothetical protein